jgi:hypothetical protein
MKNKDPKQHLLYKNLVQMLNADIPGVNFEHMMEKKLVSSSWSNKVQKHPFSRPAQQPSNNPIKNNKA